MKEDIKLTVNGTSYLMQKNFGLGVTGFNIKPPNAKTSFIDIPFSSVSYDLTEYFGSVAYERRTITLIFGFPKELPCWQKAIDEVVNLFHGQEVQLSFVSSSAWIYTGRCSVTPDTKSSYNDSTVTIEINAQPFKTNASGVSRL